MNAHWAVLADARYVNLATFRRNGAEFKTPVWIAGSNDRLYVFSAGDAGKVKRLRANSAVRLVPCTMNGRFLADGWITGTAHIVADRAVVATAYGALNDKYGWQMRIGDFFSKLTGKFDRRAMIEITVAD